MSALNKEVKGLKKLVEERESEIEGIQKQLAEKDSKISSHKDTIKQIG